MPDPSGYLQLGRSGLLAGGAFAPYKRFACGKTLARGRFTAQPSAALPRRSWPPASTGRWSSMSACRQSPPDKDKGSKKRLMETSGASVCRKSGKAAFSRKTTWRKRFVFFEKVASSAMRSVISEAPPQGALSCPFGAIHLVSPEMTDFDLIPAAACARRRVSRPTAVCGGA